MSFLQRLRNALAGPPRVADEGDSEVDATMHEEYGAPDAGEADVERIAEGGGTSFGGGTSLRAGGLAALEGAEAAEADLASEEAPTDPAP